MQWVIASTISLLKVSPINHLTAIDEINGGQIQSLNECLRIYNANFLMHDFISNVLHTFCTYINLTEGKLHNNSIWNARFSFSTCYSHYFGRYIYKQKICKSSEKCLRNGKNFSHWILIKKFRYLPQPHDTIISYLFVQWLFSFCYSFLDTVVNLVNKSGNFAILLKAFLHKL